MSSKEQQLHEACKFGNIVKAKRLIQEGADVNWKTSSMRDTPLMSAALSASPKNADLVRLLLDSGANVNDTSNRDNTALHYAAANSRDGVVRLLIERGASLHLNNNNGNPRIPLDVAKRYSESSTTSIIEVAMKATKVIYTTSSDLLNDGKVSFEGFNHNIILLTDDDVPDKFNFQEKPTFTLQHLQQCIDNISTNNVIPTNDPQDDAIHNTLSQTHPDLLQRMQHWKMNLLHLITYFPEQAATGITYQVLSSLLNIYPPQATLSVDIHGMTPIHHAIINISHGTIRSKECHDLLLTQSSPRVVHKAIEAGLVWKYLHPIVKAKVTALTVEDEESGLVPFMIAAERCRHDNVVNVDGDDDDDGDNMLALLTMVYELLCMKPDVMKEYDVSDDLKRSSDAFKSSGDGAKRSCLETSLCN